MDQSIDRQPGVNEDAAMIAGDHGAAYLDRARADSFFATLKDRTIASMAIRAGDLVVDVGCGTGEEVAAMARAADDVVARGFDLSEQAIAEARRRHSGPNIEFVVADAHSLPLDDASVDACRAERTLQHVHDPLMVTREVARVLRGGGRVVLAEPDWLSSICAGGSNRVAELVLRHWAVDRNNHPRVGRELPGLLTTAGMDGVSVTAESVIYRTIDQAERAYPLRRAVQQAVDDAIIDEADADGWLTDLETASENGSFVLAVPIFTAVGMKP